MAVADVGRSLDFYLDLDCEVRAAADGWAMLCCGPAAFVLIGQAAVAVRPGEQLPPRGSTMVVSRPVRLPTSDIRAMRRRLLAAGVRAGTITRPCHSPAGEIEVADPDGHVVVIAQPGPRSGAPAPPTPTDAGPVPGRVAVGQGSSF